MGHGVKQLDPKSQQFAFISVAAIFEAPTRPFLRHGCCGDPEQLNDGRCACRPAMVGVSEQAEGSASGRRIDKEVSRRLVHPPKHPD